MGYFFRKSASVGPFRLNFSKSGIGASVGVKGARLTTTARGTTYITVGTHGFYYRETLGGRQVREPKPQPAEPRISLANPSAIPTAQATALVDSSSAQLLKELNERARMFNPALLLYVVSGMSILAAASVGPLPLSVAALALVIGCIVHKRFNEKRTMRLFYELNDREQSKSSLLQQAVDHLSQTQRLWRIQTRTATADWKRNAGASNLIGRTQASAGLLSIPHIHTNVSVSGISMGNAKLFFLPDLVLFYDARAFGAIAYSDLRVDASTTTFIEEDGVPSDAAVVSTTWRYVNKNGGPDRRFNNNRQLPIARYGTLVLSSPSGLNIHLHVSNPEKALAFSNCWRELRNRIASRGSQTAERQTSTSPNPQKSCNPRAYSVLGIAPTATPTEIAAAYHRLAQMYHPDKVAGLAPEFQGIAEERMKEINAAYESLKARA